MNDLTDNLNNSDNLKDPHNLTTPKYPHKISILNTLVITLSTAAIVGIGWWMSQKDNNKTREDNYVPKRIERTIPVLNDLPESITLRNSLIRSYNRREDIGPGLAYMSIPDRYYENRELNN